MSVQNAADQTTNGFYLRQLPTSENNAPVFFKRNSEASIQFKENYGWILSSEEGAMAHSKQVARASQLFSSVAPWTAESGQSSGLAVTCSEDVVGLDGAQTKARACQMLTANQVPNQQAEVNAIQTQVYHSLLKDKAFYELRKKFFGDKFKKLLDSRISELKDEQKKARKAKQDIQIDEKQ